MRIKSLVLVGILIIACAAMVTPVMAADATIYGNPEAKIDLSVAPSTIDLTMTPGSSATYLVTPTITVSCNKASGWTITATDGTTGTTATSKGHMSQYTSSNIYDFTKYLSNPMTITVTDGTGYTGGSSVLSETPNTIVTGTTPLSDSSIVFGINQPVAYTDPALTDGNYQIVVTFTGSVA